MKCLRSKKRNYASDYTTIAYTITHCIFIDVPTNPGPRSFCAQPVRWCRHPRAYPTIPQLLYLREATPFPKFTNPYPIIPRSQIPRPRNIISDNTLFHVSSSSSRHAPEPKYNLKATIPSNSF
jgi:hypothetical protein